MALVGNPNTGKSTIFNALTGLNQHTGNWPGKTVSLAIGCYRWKGLRFTLVDLPGTYSLLASSPDEEVTRDFLCFNPSATCIVVVDATCLERNLSLVLQVMEMGPSAVVCLNMMDEAKKRNLRIDVDRLQAELGVPVVPCAARRGEGMTDLKDAVFRIETGGVTARPKLPVYDDSIEELIRRVLPQLEPLGLGVGPRWLALRLLERDEALIRRLIAAARA